MTINIVCTSKPVDGLLYYSYEYVSYLNACGIDCKLVIICHRKFTKADYITTINNKYVHCENVFFDVEPAPSDVTLIMGRSMMSLSYQAFNSYTHEQQNSLRMLFSGNVISVYSENHPTLYPQAVNFYSPNQIIDLCDTEVYPAGVGSHFEKTINFDIYKPQVDNIQFEYLFLGTNAQYYETVDQIIHNYPGHGILTYDEPYINQSNNNVFVPVENLLGIFETYVYTKETFDPAPRLIQECKFFNKEVIYLRDSSIRDGGSVYLLRDIKPLNIEQISRAYDQLH